MSKIFPLAKILFHLGNSEWHGFSTESVWADRIACDRCRLRNTAFFAKGVSLWDVVAVTPNDNALEFKSIIVRGGHSTYRILVPKAKPISEDEFQRRWEPLRSLGCSYQSGGFGFKLYAVEVPPNTDMQEVYRLLEKGEKEGVWDFEEGNCAHSAS